MKKSGIAAIAVAAVLVVGGGTAYALTTNPQAAEGPALIEATATNTPAPEAAEGAAPANGETSATELPSYITSPGEVCDPENLNDSLCAAFYPDQALINVTDRGSAALAGLPLDEKRDLAEQACTALAGGAPAAATAAVTGDDNRTLFSAAAVAYCPEHAESSAKWPDRTRRLIAYYQGLGEAGAKADFAGGQMPAPEKLGY